MGWINVKDSLPKENQLVIVLDTYETDFSGFSDNGYCCPDDISGANYINGEFWYEHPTQDYASPMRDIKYWIPAPPRPEK